MMLTQALQYPLRGKGSFRRLLIVTLLQLLPVVGQLILLGYGLDVVRSVYARESNLPPILWQVALRNGFLFLLAGFGYLLPILMTVGIVVGTMFGASNTSSRSSVGNVGFISLLVAIGLPVIMLFIRTVVSKKKASPSVPQPNKPGGSLLLVINGLLPVVVMILATFTLSTLVSLSGLNTGRPNSLVILLFAIFTLLIFLICTVLYIGGVRQAIENKGLLAPIANLKLLLKHRALTAHLLLRLILLECLMVITTAVGLMLFILPGLFAFVLCSIALWHLFAQYSIRAEMFTSGVA